MHRVWLLFIVIAVCMVCMGVCALESFREGDGALRGIVLQAFIGGLGNQLFQVAALMSLARRNGVVALLPRQDVSGGYVNSPTYSSNLLQAFSTTEVQPNWPVLTHGSQFGYENTQGFVDRHKENSEFLVIAGAFMNLRYSVDVIDELRDMLFPAYRKEGASHRVMLGLRSWTEEQKPEWRIPLDFYQTSLQHLPDTKFEFLVLTDDEAYARETLAALNIDRYQVVVGNRGSDSIKVQYEKAMQCDHFILGYSTFHIWPALFAQPIVGHRKCIIYPKVEVMTSIEMEVYPHARFVCVPVPESFKPFS